MVVLRWGESRATEYRRPPTSLEEYRKASLQTLSHHTAGSIYVLRSSDFT